MNNFDYNYLCKTKILKEWFLLFYYLNKKIPLIDTNEYVIMELKIKKMQLQTIIYKLLSIYKYNNNVYSSYYDLLTSHCWQCLRPEYNMYICRCYFCKRRICCVSRITKISCARITNNGVICNSCFRQ